MTRTSTLRGNNIVNVNWPACGEMDVLERVNAAGSPGGTQPARLAARATPSASPITTSTMARASRTRADVLSFCTTLASIRAQFSAVGAPGEITCGREPSCSPANPSLHARRHGSEMKN